MRLLITALACLLTLSLWAQDGINYQGAATDANGDELTNQNITLRASVLSASANGNLEWEETHSATTDQFGLFNVVIGQGTNTTNGATANFDEMDWGSANHFLKIEMDATGGDNYAMIGATQMMSVPYALYAKSAGIDSTMLANIIGLSGGFNYDRGFRDAFSISNPSQWCTPYQQVITLDSISNITNEVIYEIDYSLYAGYASGCGIEIYLINQDNEIIPILVNTSNQDSFSNSFQRSVWYSSSHSERLFIKAYPEIGSTIYLQLDFLGEIAIGTCTNGCNNIQGGGGCSGANVNVSGSVILH